MRVKKSLMSWLGTTFPISSLKHQQDGFTWNAKDTSDRSISGKWSPSNGSILVSISGYYSISELYQILDGLRGIISDMHMKRYQQNG